MRKLDIKCQRKPLEEIPPGALVCSLRRSGSIEYFIAIGCRRNRFSRSVCFGMPTSGHKEKAGDFSQCHSVRPHPSEKQGTPPDYKTGRSAFFTDLRYYLLQLRHLAIGLLQIFPWQTKKYSCHILKSLESIDIPGIADVLRYSLLFAFLAYPGIKRHSFDSKSSTGSSKSGVFVSFYYSPFAIRLNFSCVTSKSRCV